MTRDETIALLVAVGWSKSTASAFLRAKFKCEYCGRDFLASIESLKQLEVDHIDRSLKGPDREEQDNIAISCRHCNTHLKGRWNPTKIARPNSSREELIDIVKTRLDELRNARQAKLDRIRKIVGYRSRDA